MELAALFGRYWIDRGRFHELVFWWRALPGLPGAEARTLARARMILQFWRGAVFRDEDDAETSVALLEEALSITREVGTPADEARAVFHLALRLHDLGRPAARARFEQALAQSRAHGFRLAEPACLRFLGSIARGEGDLAGALALQEQSLEVARRINGDWIVADALSGLVDTLIQTGHVERALPLAEEAVQRFRSARAMPRLADSLATLARLRHKRGDLRAARTHFEESLAIRRASGQRWNTVAILVALAEVTRALGDAAVAQRTLEEARSLAREVGDDAGARAAADALRTLSEPPPSGRADTHSPLSAREREVATLIAEGLTNRQIGERLVISERTVDNHVQRILSKLGLVRRTQVAAWVSGGGDRRRAAAVVP
jgi:non-specific serine/threonine protein kinase